MCVWDQRHKQRLAYLSVSGQIANIWKGATGDLGEFNDFHQTVSQILKAYCAQDWSNILDRVTSRDFVTVNNMLLLLYQRGVKENSNKE